MIILKSKTFKETPVYFNVVTSSRPEKFWWDWFVLFKSVSTTFEVVFAVVNIIIIYLTKLRLMNRPLHNQDGDDFSALDADHFDVESMRRKKLIPSFHRTLQSRVRRVGTLKGFPRLFFLRRAFCLYWVVIISLLIYLKWYYPLYLTNTTIRSTVQDFSTDWCRIRNARIDWKRIHETCEGNTVYETHLPGWGEENRTNGRYSFVESMDIRPVGEFSRITMQTLTAYGRLKSVGGDYWRVFISGPTGFAPTVFDRRNGLYEILFLVLQPGNYCLSAVLDHSICEGMKDPPNYWFISGEWIHYFSWRILPLGVIELTLWVG